MTDIFLKSDIEFMERALFLASQGEGFTYPNPMVGAVVVRDGTVMGEGYHERAGSPHAEVMALDAAGDNASGATIYVTLEPCAHYGRTPPCTEAILKSGLKRVVIACSDPAGHNRGRGIKKLRDSGVKVDVGLLEEKALCLNRQYFKFVNSRLPYVTLKSAQTVDGRIADAIGSSKWITSSAAREHAHMEREAFCAILAGIGTVMEDDPFLLKERSEQSELLRVVVDSCLRLPIGSNIVKTRDLSPVLVASTDNADRCRAEELKDMGIEILFLPSKDGRVSLSALLESLAERDIVSVLVEGGAGLTGSFLKEGLADEVMIYMAPKIMGGGLGAFELGADRRMKDMTQLKFIEQRMIGPDMFLRAAVEKKGS